LPFGETYRGYTTTKWVDTDILRYSQYQSLATPSSVIDFNMKTKGKEIKKSKKFWEANLIKIIISKSAFGLQQMVLKCQFLCRL
jgi:hypothetical protein